MGDSDHASRSTWIRAERAAPGTEPVVDLAAGDLLLNGTYRIEQRLGDGGMGIVYRALNTITGAPAAIKIIRPELARDPFLQELFSREAAALRSVRDDAVVGYEGVFRDEGGRLLLAMAYIDGPSLAERMRAQPLTVDEVLSLGDRLARGLAAAHALDVFHRDLSPDNILLPGGRLDKAVIIDFGIAKRAGAPQQTIYGQQQSFIGKLNYASPEQAGLYPGSIDGRSDIYSLGLVLAAAYLGRPLPMGEDPMSAVTARTRIPDLGKLPDTLQQQLRPLLQPDPTQRPQEMSRLFTTGGGAGRAPRQRRARPRGGATAPARRWWLIGGAAAAVAGSAVVVLWLLWEPPPPLPTLPDAGSLAAGLADPPPPADPVPAPAPPAAADPAPPTTVPEPLLARVAPTAPTAPVPPDGELQALLERRRATIPCSDLAVTVSEGRARVSGRVASTDQLGLLRRWPDEVPGLAEVETAVRVEPRPDCLAVADLAATMPGRSAPPELELSRADGVYRADRDVFMATVRAPATWPAYLYVDYFHENGEVYHLLPEPLHRDNLAAPGAVLRIGREAAGARPDERVWALSEPFGAGTVLVLASETPLYEGFRPIGESSEAYLAFIRPALDAAARRGRVAHTVADILTQPGY